MPIFFGGYKYSYGESMIAGIGIDIVEIARLKAAIEKFGSHFIARMCTEPEQAGHYHLSEGDIIYYAGRWAAKEALAKALGCGIGNQCSFTDITVANDLNGSPKISLTGSAQETYQKIGGRAIKLSISHEHSYAVAMVVIEG